MSTQTIAAVGTALSNSGISIIRISGDRSLNIVNKIFITSKKIEPNTIVYGKIVDKDIILDTVLVSYFKAPRSYTGEDICEINCHGGIQITKQILELVLENGAVLAEPGEFSKRAFLNGKMDLSQAEAVMSLINAKNKTNTKIASNQLEGKLSKKINKIREKLIELMAGIEVSVDYPEYDYEDIKNASVNELLDSTILEINKLIDTYEQGKYISDGVNVAILGKPNAGKSSLLNNLANYEKAIVTDIPGTTRDVLDETINIDKLILNISDTAGIRKTDNVVEKIGVERSLKKLDEVDLVIYLLNAEVNIDNEDLEILSKIQNKGLKLIVAINKIDKKQKTIFEAIMKELDNIDIENVIEISATDNVGINELKNKIINLFNVNDFDFTNELMITNIRHKDLLKKSIEDLNKAKEEIRKDMPIDIISIYIKDASDLLGQIIGTKVSEDIINKIFEKFCLGK